MKVKAEGRSLRSPALGFRRESNIKAPKTDFGTDFARRASVRGVYGDFRAKHREILAELLPYEEAGFGKIF